MVASADFCLTSTYSLFRFGQILLCLPRNLSYHRSVAISCSSFLFFAACQDGEPRRLGRYSRIDRRRHACVTTSRAQCLGEPKCIMFVCKCGEVTFTTSREFDKTPTSCTGTILGTIESNLNLMGCPCLHGIYGYGSITSLNHFTYSSNEALLLYICQDPQHG